NPPPVAGTWQGRSSSRNFASLPVTLVINQGVGVKLPGAVNLAWPCLRSANLQVIVSGSNVVLAGGNAAGDTITFRGTLDSVVAQLTMTYILMPVPLGSAKRMMEREHWIRTRELAQRFLCGSAIVQENSVSTAAH